MSDVKYGRKIFSQDKVERFKEMWGTTELSNEQLGAFLGMSATGAHRFASRLGLPARPRPTKFPADIDDILRRDVGIFTYQQIADRYGSGLTAVKNRAYALGLSADKVRKSLNPPKPTKITHSENPHGFLFAKHPQTPRTFTTEVRGDVPVRRFEMGASGLGNDDFLKKCGYEIKQDGTKPLFRVKKAGAQGRPKVLSRSQLIAFLDEERAKRGLEPIRRAA